MGLDISVYTNVKMVESPEDVECIYEWIDEQEGNLTHLFANPSFPNHFEESGAYSYESRKSVLSRSYSGWGNLRDVLAKAAGYSTITEQECWERQWDFEHTKTRPYQWKAFSVSEGPLHELINFSDCEGVIKHAYCIKIYDDLVNHIDTEKLDECGLRSYHQLVEGFKFAAENQGVVDFH